MSYQEILKNCQYCDSNNISFGKMEDFNLKPYASGYCYYCNDCKKYIVTHKNDIKKAMGTIADGETKNLRKQCHEAFDDLWHNSMERKYYYAKLSKCMNLRLEECHFGHMDQSQLEQALIYINELAKEKASRKSQYTWANDDEEVTDDESCDEAFEVFAALKESLGKNL